VHFTAWAYAFYAVAAALMVLRHVRAATILEAEGIRMRGAFSSRYLPWGEVAGIEIRERGKARLLIARTLSGEAVRMPAPIAGGGFDSSEFAAQAAEISAAWAAAHPGGGGIGHVGRDAGPLRSESHRF
jgi:hypothetical protein